MGFNLQSYDQILQVVLERLLLKPVVFLGIDIVDSFDI